MNTHLSELLSGLPPAVARSMWLWPDPLSAPDVPPVEVLRRFVESSQSPEWAKLDYDIEAQIAESVNCRRALEHLGSRPLRVPGNEAVSGWRQAPEERVAKVLERLRAPASGQAPASPVHAETGSHLEPGQLWTVSTRAEMFDGTRYMFRRRWRVTDALVVQPLWEDQFGEEFVRVVAASPVWHWPRARMAADEMLVGVPGVGEYVAHLWLEFPFHVDQCEALLGTLDEAERENLLVGRASWHEGHPPDEAVRCGLPLNDSDDAPICEERERLFEVASWLCATADARRLSTETALEEARVALPDEVLPLAALQKLEEWQRLSPAAGAGAVQTPCFAHAGSLAEMIAAFVEGRALPGLRPFSAVLKPARRQLRSSPHWVELEWELVGRPAEIRGGETFFVVNKRSRRVVAARGRTQPGGVFAWVACARLNELRDTPESDLVLLFPNIK